MDPKGPTFYTSEGLKMNPKGPTFHTHDTGIFVQENRPARSGVLSFVYEDQDSHDTYEALRMLLKASGFSFHRDPQVVKNYRSIAHLHHHGQRGPVEFSSEIFGIGFKIEFYQNVVHENQHGGQYDFDKREKMPYLLGLRFEWIKRKIVAMLVERGYACTDDPPVRDATERVTQSQRKSAEWHPFVIDGPYQTYNVTDADGRLLTNGCERYFYHHGCLMRGRVYMGLNNCHNIVLDHDWIVWQEFCFRMFSYRPGLARRWFPLQTRLDRINAALQKAVKAEDFERAAKIKAARERLMSEHPEQLRSRSAA